MVMEVLGAEIIPGQAKTVIDEEINIEKNKMINKADCPEKFDLLNGSSVVNGASKEVEHVADFAAPKDAVDEWPENKQTHYFYFIRFRSYEDPKLKTKIEQADKEVQRKTQARIQITEALKEKRSEKADLISQLKPLQEEERQFRAVMDGKRKEMEPLQAALGKLRVTKNTAAEKGVGLCSSEEELNDTIKSLQYCIQHESNTLAEEKQLLKEIKLLEASREKVIANAAMRSKIQESFGQRDVIQDQVKLIGSDLDGVRKEQQAIRAKIQNLEEKLNGVRAQLDSLQNELVIINEARDKAYQIFTLLRKERDESNSSFFEHRSLMNNAKGLSITKDVSALKELSLNEVEKFMSRWSGSKSFRDDYEKRMLPSLDARQLSRDGRMRNFDEKPILFAPQAIPEPEKEPVKPEKELGKPTSKKEKESAISPPPEVLANAALEAGEISSESRDIDPEKLKEMKREEEIVKAKSAMERKKKLADKAAVKAAVRAQKEAEKKQKEKEKKARKKAGTSSLQPADAELSEEAEPEKDAEPEMHEGITNAPSAERSKDKVKERSFHSRGRSKVQQNQIPKILLKKKKQHPSWWLWAAAPAAICAFLVALAGLYYSLRKAQ